MSIPRNKIELILKISITIILLVFLVTKIKPQNIDNTLTNAKLSLLMLSMLLTPLLYLIRAIKWNLLLKCSGINEKFSKVFIALVIGVFYGILTPGKTGELMRVFYIPHEKSKTLPTILWEKLTDIFALILLSILSIIIFFNNSILVYSIFLLLFVVVIGIFFIMNERIVNFVFNLLSISKESKGNYLKGMYKILYDKGVMFRAFALTLLYYTVVLIVGAVILRALDPDIDILLTFSLPILILLGNLPITISGLGLREFVAVLCFNVLGEETSIGFSFSILLFSIIIVIPGIVGYILTIINPMSFTSKTRL
ncbi:MAG: UPF0104 family protein [Candidatus Altiarchaeales archaeon]|nr:MAG: UPF0104 family protein [Candidatus Altiarchaeales archaeon]